MLSIISLPTVEQLLTYSSFGSGATSTGSSTLANQASALFNEMLPYSLAVLGLIVGALFVRFIVLGGVKGAITTITGKGRRGGRRRRR